MQYPKINVLFTYILLACLCWSSLSTKAQKTYFGEEEIKWESNKAISIPTNARAYLSSDLLVLDEKTQFYFYATNNEKVVKNTVIKINTKKGLELLKAFKLPESFDYAYDACFFKQGRTARIKAPFISDFRVLKLAARKLLNNRWIPVVLDHRYETVRWTGSSGKFLEDDMMVFTFESVSVGDVIEIQYELQFNSGYGSNLFYFNGPYPKLNCEYDFIYKINEKLDQYKFVLPVYVADSLVTKTVSPSSADNYIIRTDKIKIGNLAAVNYPANSFEGRSLPHVFVDFNFYRAFRGSYSRPNDRVYEYDLVRAPNFEWLNIKDTTNHYVKIYDKQFASVRKFVATLPPVGTDSSHKEFFKALCDTFNAFRYITMNQLYYNESNLYDISSGDHLLKRRIAGSGWKVTQDILNDNKIFYFTANVQDRRYGEHSIYYRAHYGYERNIMAIPSQGSYIYFVPRNNGLKYHLNELPFYYEGVLAALSPHNFQEDTENKDGQYFKFIKTHKGTYNENTRTENATIRIVTDSLKAGLMIKESLSGQFSTLLRHIYLNEYVDSTISPHYFKKCTAKPGASDIKIKKSSNITDFPFRYNFNCTETVKLNSPAVLDLKNWFSFTLSKEVLPEQPTHDYYLDFEFSDAYNFMLEFTQPTEIGNAAAFSRQINNAFFDLESGIVKNSETSYLLKVKLIVKERKIPREQAGLLMDLAAALDELNSFTLQLAKK